MAKRSPALALVILVGAAAGACQSISVYNRPVKTFQEGYSAAAPVVRDVYTRLNDFRRDAYFTRALCDPSFELLERDSAGRETALNHNEFSAASIQARVDAVELMGRYADRLAALATVDAEADARITNASTELGTNLAGLAQHFADLPDGTASSYGGPVGQIAGVVINAYQNHRRIGALRDAIVGAAVPVRTVLDLLETDLGEITRQVHAPTHDALIARCAIYYNDNRARWSDGERRTVLREVQALVDRREAFRNNDPVELVRAMREAHEALVRFVQQNGRPTPAQLAELGNTMETFTHRVENVAASLRALRDVSSVADGPSAAPSPSGTNAPSPTPPAPRAAVANSPAH